MSSPLDQERAEMILALNGNPVNAEMAWQIIHRWDALVNIAKAAEDAEASVGVVLPAPDSEQTTVMALIEEWHEAADAIERLREALAALGNEPA